MSTVTTAPELSPPVVELIDERTPWLDDEMAGALASASPDLPLYDWVRYHLGWLDGELRPFSPAERKRHGGKRLRGVLCILAGEAVGGLGRAVAPAGAAIEFVHNFSLVHDDVEDNDAERRHRPTVWTLWGVPHAINVGSSMQAMVNVALLRLAEHHAPPLVVESMAVLTRAIVRMTEGQYLDMAAEDAHEATLSQYFRMSGGKTAALIEAGLRVGALLGDADPDQREELAIFGREFGLAFQCVDDFLGIWGEPGVTGKPVGSDIIAGKRSLPIVYALERSPTSSEAGRRLRAALDARDVPAVIACLDAVGTREFAITCADRHTGDSLAALERAGVVNRYGDAMRAIADYALSRES